LTLAILGESESPLTSLVLAELSKNGEINLVERDQIYRILKEQVMDASGLLDVHSRLKLGAILPADAILYITHEAALDSKITRARIFESRTAILIADILAEGDDNTVTALIAGAVHHADELLRDPHRRRRYVAVLGVRNEEPGGELTSLSAALAVFLKNDLMNVPGVVVLEREDLQVLIKEAQLTDIELELKTASYLLEAGLRRDGEELLISLNSVSEANPSKQTVQFKCPLGDIRAMRRVILAKTLALIQSTETIRPEGDRGGEAEIFARRAQYLLSHHQNVEAAPLAEAALALSPTPAYYGLAFDSYAVIPGDLTNNTIAMLRHSLRFQEIGLEHVRSLLKQSPGAPGYSCMFTLFMLHQIQINTNSAEERELSEQIRSTLFERYNLLKQARQQSGVKFSEILIGRLYNAIHIAESSADFCRAVKDVRDEFPRQSRDLDRFRCTLLGQIVSASELVQAGKWEARSLDALLDDYSRDKDPAIRMIALCVKTTHPDPEGLEAAETIWNTMLFDLPASDRFAYYGSYLETPASFEQDLSRIVARRLQQSNRLEPYLDDKLSMAEKRNDATFLLHWPTTLQWGLIEITQEERHRLGRRILALIDRKAYASNDIPATAKEFREYLIWLLEYESGPTGRDSHPLGGEWRGYSITPIPVSDRPGNGRSLVYVHADAHSLTAPFILIWGPSMSPQLSQEQQESVVTRLSRSGGKPQEIGRFRSKINPRHVAVLGNSIFVATWGDGLYRVGDGASQRFDEHGGLPSMDIRDMVVFDKKLFLAFCGALAVFDPDTGRFQTIASSMATIPKCPLDGGFQYEVVSLLADEKRDCLWVSVNGLRDQMRSGIWRFLPATNSWEKVCQGRVDHISWSDDKICFKAVDTEAFSQFSDMRHFPFLKLSPDARTLARMDGVEEFSPSVWGASEPGWASVDQHIFDVAGYLHSPDGKAYRPPQTTEAHQLSGTWQQIQGFRQGVIIAQYESASLWYVEPKP